MPSLPKEVCVFPDHLLDEPSESPEPPEPSDSAAAWWALYTKSRQEKHVMRKLHAMQIPFYCPIVARPRKVQGRVRTSYVPLFPSYVFVYADELQRGDSLTTNCICQCHPVPDGEQLRRQLQQLERLIQIGVPLTLESRLVPGTRVKIKTGPFKGIEGVVFKRHSQRRLIVGLDYLEQGVSVRLHDFEVETLDAFALNEA